MYKFSKKEDDWLKINYPKLGPNKCAEFLNLKKQQISIRASKLKIFLPKELKNLLCSKKPENCCVNPNLFYNITTKEIAYLLGIIWSDGFLNQSKNGYNHHLGFTIIKDDFITLKPILESIGKFNYYERKPKFKSWKTTVNIITNNKRIFNFLVENDFDKKSYTSADKILSKIPNDLKHYFFRGLIDGDGCFYYYKPKIGSTLRQFAISSTIDQDWTYFENLCKELNIEYKIKRIKGDKSSYSSLRICNKNGISNLGYYIYNNIEIDQMGLKRKYEKFKLIMSSYTTT